MSIDRNKVVVIGGAGFIGSHVVDALLEEDVDEIVVFDNFARGSIGNLESALRDPRVRVIEGDIQHPDVLRSAMENAGYVFHLAALWLLHCYEYPRAAFQVNVEGTLNVLEACRDLGVRRLIFSSSASVYGDTVGESMAEDNPLNNTTFYGATKISGEQMCLAFAHRYGMEMVGLRYMNVYGPRQPTHGAYTGVITSMLERLSSNQPLIVHGDGSQTYDFIYVKDVARANLCAASSTVSKGFYNVGRGEGTTILDLARLLIEITGMDVDVEFREDRKLAVRRRIADIQKAQEELGFRARVSLRTGLRALLDWWRTTQNSGA